MKLFKLFSIALLMSFALALSTAPAMAETEVEQEQELEQKCEVTCETGAYGQETTCTNKCYQHGKQNQTVTLRDGTVLAAHTPINTALDTRTVLAVAGVLSLGVLTAIIRKKLV